MGLLASFTGAKSKTKKQPYPRTKEMKALFKSFMEDFFGGTAGGLSFEDALNQASAKTTARYKAEVAAPRKEYFGENRGLLSRLISETEANRKPINIGFGGEDLMTFTPHTQKLSGLVGQRAGLESDYLTGTGGDIGLLHQLALEPKTRLMDFYQNFLLPMELARFGTTGTQKTTGSQWGVQGDATSAELAGLGPVAVPGGFVGKKV